MPSKGEQSIKHCGRPVHNERSRSYLHRLEVDQQVFWFEVCFAKTNMNIASLVCTVLNLASFEILDRLYSSCHCRVHLFQFAIGLLLAEYKWLAPCELASSKLAVKEIAQ